MPRNCSPLKDNTCFFIFLYFLLLLFCCRWAEKFLWNGGERISLVSSSRVYYAMEILSFREKLLRIYIIVFCYVTHRSYIYFVTFLCSRVWEWMAIRVLQNAALRFYISLQLDGNIKFNNLDKFRGRGCNIKKIDCPKLPIHRRCYTIWKEKTPGGTISPIAAAVAEHGWPIRCAPRGLIT